MVTLDAHFDGKAIIPDERTTLPAGARLRVTIERIDEPATPAQGTLELPLLTGLAPEIVRSIMDGPEFDVANADTERFLDPHHP